jgi:hypothetical protein
MKLESEQTYNNIYPFYESARQARTERRERNKEKKKENALKRIKIREDCLKKAVVTKGSELEILLFKYNLMEKLKAYLKFKYWAVSKNLKPKAGRRKLISAYMEYTGFTEYETNERLINALMDMGFTKKEANKRLDKETNSLTILDILIEVGFTKDKAKRITRIH